LKIKKIVCMSASARYLPECPDGLFI